MRNEKINYKVREHSLAKVPVMLVCGKREAEEKTVNIRRLGSRDQASATVIEPLLTSCAAAGAMSAVVSAKANGIRLVMDSLPVSVISV